MGGPWNHNIHYHDVVLKAVPPNCGRALDIGCGEGRLARQLAPLCREVLGIDKDHDTLMKAATHSEPGVSFVEGDVLTHPLPEAGFDLISAVATLHHLPLTLALKRFRDLLRPCGVLAIVGLYREHTAIDYCWAAAAVPAKLAMLPLRGYSEVQAPVREPTDTLAEIRAACGTLLPGGVFRRRLYFRYSFVWRKP